MSPSTDEVVSTRENMIGRGFGIGGSLQEATTNGFIVISIGIITGLNAVEVWRALLRFTLVSSALLGGGFGNGGSLHVGHIVESSRVVTGLNAVEVWRALLAVSDVSVGGRREMSREEDKTKMGSRLSFQKAQTTGSTHLGEVDDRSRERSAREEHSSEACGAHRKNVVVSGVRSRVWWWWLWSA
jgi:hypothetical protein